MKPKAIILSFVASAITSLPVGYASILQSKKLKAKDVKLEFYPVKHSKTDLKDGLELNGESYLKITKKPVLILEDFSYEPHINTNAGIKMLLDKKNATALEKTTRKYGNTKLALVHNGEVLTTQNMKNIVQGDDFEVTLNDPSKMETVLKSLNEA